MSHHFKRPGHAPSLSKQQDLRRLAAAIKDPEQLNKVLMGARPQLRDAVFNLVREHLSFEAKREEIPALNPETEPEPEAA